YAAIESEPWLNNIRQLENYVVRCAVLCDTETLEPVVPPPSRETRRRRQGAAPTSQWLDAHPAGDRPATPDTALEDAERRWMTAALAEANGNQRQAAILLGLKESTLRYKLRSLSIEGPDGGAHGTLGPRGTRPTSQEPARKLRK